MFCVVSHPRSGTHLLCKYIFDNFQTPYGDYFDLFASHHLDFEGVRKKFPTACILHIIRGAEHTLKSVFRMRERNGIDFGFDDFSAFLRTKYCDMPRTTKTKTILYNGDNPTQHRPVSWIGQQDSTPIELWLRSNLYWFKNAQVISLTYSSMKNNPGRIMDFLEDMTRWKRKKNLRMCEGPVGLRPLDNKDFAICDKDMSLLHETETRFYEEIGYEPFVEAC